MSIRVWGTSLLMFLSTVTAVGQTANHYLKAPLPNDWEESGEVFQQILPVEVIPRRQTGLFDSSGSRS